MDAMNVKDIIEENGKTIEQNNLEKKHNIPIGTLVEVKYDEWFGDGACQKVHARLWVVSHDRDCDGTPLYTLSSHRGDVFPKGRILFDSQTETLGEVELNSDICKSILNQYKSGFGEERLTPIELNDKIVDGEGSLEWGDDK